MVAQTEYTETSRTIALCYNMLHSSKYLDCSRKLFSIFIEIQNNTLLSPPMSKCGFSGNLQVNYFVVIIAA